MTNAKLAVTPTASALAQHLLAAVEELLGNFDVALLHMEGTSLIEPLVDLPVERLEGTLLCHFSSPVLRNCSLQPYNCYIRLR